MPSLADAEQMKTLRIRRYIAPAFTELGAVKRVIGWDR
jgi:hypothetical protein